MHDEITSLLRHEDFLRRRALQRAGNASDAEDLMQDLWLALLSSPPEGVTSEKAFLAGMLRHLSVSGFRRERARKRREEKAARSEALPSAAEDAERRALRKSLLSELLNLDEPYRRSLLLRHVSDMGAQEISEYLGVPAATVRSHLHRGVAILRGRMGLEDERKRRRARALILPFLPLPKRGAWFTAAAAVVVATSLSLALAFLGDEEKGAQLGFQESAAVEETSGMPLRNELEPASPRELVVETGVADEGPRLRGRIELVGPAAKDFVGDLLAASTPVLTGPESNFLGLMAVESERPLASELEFRLCEDGRYELPVAEAGQHHLHLRLAGRPGLVRLNQSTEQLVDRRIRMLGDLSWRSARAGLSFRWRDESGTARDLGADFELDGPFLPGAEIEVEDAVSGLSWRTELREESAGVAPPAGQLKTLVRLVESDGGVLAGAEVVLRCWGRDHREWSLRLRSDAEGRVFLPRLSTLEGMHEASLSISHPRCGCIHLPDHEQALPPDRGQPLVMRIDAARTRSFTLVDEKDEPLFGVFGVALCQQAILGWDTSDAEGRLTIDPRRVDEPRYFVPLLTPEGPVLWFTYPEVELKLVFWREDRGYFAASSTAGARISWPASDAREVFVHDSATRSGLAEVAVRVVLQDGLGARRIAPRLPALGDEAGRVQLPPIAGSGFALLVEKDGYAAKTVELADLAGGPIVLDAEPSPGFSQRIRLVDEAGRPLADVRCALGEAGDPTEQRYATDHEGRITFRNLRPDAQLQFRALPSGRELSLDCVTTFMRTDDELSFSCVPLATTAIRFGQAEDEAKPLVLVLERSGGQRRVLSGNEALNELLLTQEPQSLTVYRAGLQTESLDWRPELGPVRFERRAGFSISGTTPVELGAGTILFEPLDIAARESHTALLDRAFMQHRVEVQHDGGRFASPPLAAGLWRLFYLRDGEVLATCDQRISADIDLGPIFGD